MLETDILYQFFLENPAISTDTRKIQPNSIFFALKGANFNGNAFAKEALEKGALYAVIDEKAYKENDKYILVDDALKALQSLARKYRDSFQIPFIAVGGSNGKTTTKELIHKVLSKKYKTFATQGNLNNHIGVPLTLLSIPQDTEMAVIELGANHIGETTDLCEIANPNYGIITNIGLDHLEGFGSLEGVAQANSELYYHLLKSQGKIFLNTNEEHLVRMASRFPKELVITYPNTDDYFSAALLPSEFYLTYETEAKEVVNTQMIGKYNFANISTALCIGKYFNVSSHLANEAISEYAPSNNRSQLLKKDSNTIILDAYNANPSSMKEAIENMDGISSENKMVILGQMNEMGTYSQQEHENLGKLIASKNIQTVVLYGEEMQYALSYLPKAYYFTDKFSLHNWLQDTKPQNQLILIKGSRGAKMETVLDFL
ncbi:MAG: UDP-N-acetylmuramoyl-tripeptide--D-alanyl-D-alanine ligase [Raineya sp.]|jgi:UDP-N-acetylmuramoyl-tripeptide--D-alanyl-D-alanine ligase|nr:UDP-N-acetylmuramoyl-tripeptide--D-alanyl-D-alanine ligase [Raineya sp.]